MSRPEYLPDAPFDLVTLDAYLLHNGSFELRDTDGVTRIWASLERSRLNIEVEGVKERLGLRLIPLAGVPSVNTVHMNGVALTRVDALEVGPGTAAGWTRDGNGTVRVMLHHR